MGTLYVNGNEHNDDDDDNDDDDNYDGCLLTKANTTKSSLEK